MKKQYQVRTSASKFLNANNGTHLFDDIADAEQAICESVKRGDKYIQYYRIDLVIEIVENIRQIPNQITLDELQQMGVIQ